MAKRRRACAEAVWRVIHRDGLDGASVRGVAAEARLSTGSVRHFFSSQAELHAFAMTELTVSVTRRIETADRTKDPIEALVAMLGELLPLTVQTRLEFFAWLQFASRAPVDPHLAAVAKEGFDAMRALYVRIVERQCELELISPSTEVQSAAQSLGVVMDGITMQLLLAPHLLDRQTAMRILLAHLNLPESYAEGMGE